MQAREPTTILRFIDAPGDETEARIAEVLRDAEAPQPLGALALSRVRERLSSSRRTSAPPIRFAALLAMGMLAGTGFAVASYGVTRLVESNTSVPEVGAPARAPHGPATVARAKAATPTALPTEAAMRAETPKATPTEFSEATESELGRESELLSRALAKLRRDHDPRTALQLLDEHERSFPSGVLRLEADVARVDALLALGRDAEALALLQRLPIDRVGRSSELRVIRGELLAQKNPKLALADFDAALKRDLPRELEERALFGRAASRIRAGDEASGRADLETYLSKYPDGRFSEQARRSTSPHR